MLEAFGNNFLGIDWGASYVGIAFSNAETRMAFAVCSIKNDKTLLATLGELFSEREIGTAVIGIPSHVNRRDAVYGGEILAEAIRKEFPSVRIEFQDEMFTTKMASANLREHGIRNISRFDDQEAARIILQEWLDSRNT